MSCSKCDKKAYVKYKDKNYCIGIVPRRKDRI